MNPAQVRLGKKPYRHDDRTLKAAELLAEAPLTISPSTLDWFKGGPASGMMANDQYGDCTIAAAGHLVQTWTGNNGSVVTIPDDQLVSTYFTLSGGEDSGLVMLDVLNYWRTTGIAGHKILGFALADPYDQLELQQASLLFGGLYLGLNMPRAWQWQTVWDVAAGSDGVPGTWGGHAVSLGTFDADGIEIFTWGYRQRVTWGGIRKYCDEPWAVFSPEWLKSGKSPSDFLQDALETRISFIE